MNQQKNTIRRLLYAECLSYLAKVRGYASGKISIFDSEMQLDYSMLKVEAQKERDDVFNELKERLESMLPWNQMKNQADMAIIKFIKTIRVLCKIIILKNIINEMNESNNVNMNKSKSIKNDEFYTLIEDIEKEISYYKDQLIGKIVYCNCDDFRKSNFIKYFLNNFKSLGLNKLICTSYNENGNGLYFSYDGITPYNGKLKR